MEQIESAECEDHGTEPGTLAGESEAPQQQPHPHERDHVPADDFNIHRGSEGQVSVQQQVNWVRHTHFTVSEQVES